MMSGVEHGKKARVHLALCLGPWQTRAAAGPGLLLARGPGQTAACGLRACDTCHQTRIGSGKFPLIGGRGSTALGRAACIRTRRRFAPRRACARASRSLAPQSSSSRALPAPGLQLACH